MPTHFNVLFTMLLTTFSCTDTPKDFEIAKNKTTGRTPEKEIRGIYLPKGFSYVDARDSLYAAWLLDLKFKKSRSVYLYNGQLKSDQFVHYRVLDIDIGKKDLLQCADAAIKLKADFLFEKKPL